MAGEELKEIAQLLRRGLDYAPWLAREGWQKEVKPVTRPFLERIRDALAESIGVDKSRFGFANPGKAKKKRSALDSLYLSMIRGSVRVSIGYESREEDWDDKLVWGFEAWGKEDDVRKVGTLFQRLSLDQLSTFAGVFHSATFGGGTTFAVVNLISADELESADPDQLVSRIVADLTEWYTQIQAHRAEIEVLVLGEQAQVIPEETRFWKISPGEGAYLWNKFVQLGCIATGNFKGLGRDLRAFSSQDEIRTWMEKHGVSGKLDYKSRQLWWIKSGIQVGDIVFAYGGKSILGVAEVTGEYEFIEDEVMKYAHRRRVTWLSEQSRPIGSLTASLRGKLQKNETIVQLTQKEGEAILSLYPGIRLPPLTGSSFLTEHLAARGLHFAPHQLATFATALQTRGFVILSGISGTGKTRLAQYFADLMPRPEAKMTEQPETTTQPSNHLFVPVRPDWRDSKSLLGYYNPLAEQFESTEFLRFILRVNAHYDEHGADARPYFVILDEMNLARVEYYFADFLSVLESGRDDDGITREAITLHTFRQSIVDADGRSIPPTLRLPPNLYFVGTVNVDETTHAFSPKVLDRAFTIELTEADFSDYPPQLDPDSPQLCGEQQGALVGAFTRRGRFAVVDKKAVSEFVVAHPQYRAHLQKLSELLRPYDLHFAYRVFDEIIAFCANAESAPWFDGFRGLDDAFDTTVLMKILPKFHGSRGRLLEPLRHVLAWTQHPDDPDAALSGVEEDTKDAISCLLLRQALDDRLDAPNLPTSQSTGLPLFVYPRTARKTARMLRELYDTGFASFS